MHNGRTPELTVAMPVYNAGPYIRQAVESVLCQEGVDLELIIVDDGSTDDSATVIESLRNDRVRLVRNDRRRGIGYCHNVILRASRAPFLAHVDADDFLLRGALRKLLEAVKSDPHVAQSHCYFFDVDAQGRTTQQAFHQRWRHFHRGRPTTMDYKERLVLANVANALRTYRRSVLEELGGFNETLRFGVDYEMALRLVDRYAIKLVPEFLYVRRVHSTNTTESLRFRDFQFWAQNYRIRSALVRQGKVRFLSGSQFDLLRFVRRRLRFRFESLRDRWRDRRRRTAERLRWRVVAPWSVKLYHALMTRLSWWPLGWFHRQANHIGPPCIGYYTARFPALSETFIQREVTALRQAGIAVKTVAQVADDERYLGDEAKPLLAQTSYVDPIDERRLSAYVRRFLRRRPFRFANLFLYVVFQPHRIDKSFAVDLILFKRALYAAGLMEESAVTHVHAPWANTDALIALLAARMLGVTYSVQARASDIHKTTAACGLGERLAHAQFVVTNARYNQATLQSALPRGVEKPIVTIYEGIDPKQFRPAPRRSHQASVWRILSVARLTEPKGLEYLIQASKILKDAGHAVCCEVIGGKAAAEVNYYLALQRLRRALGVENDVVFLGPQPFDRVLAKYGDADVFVLPAVPASDGRRDITPNVVIEAMAMQLPIVSTTSGAIPELIEDGVHGLLVPPRDPAALARAIIRLLEDDALRAQLGANARARVEERFDINRNIRAYVALFGGGSSDV
ncbi:MAG TPA: glycosyltransferase [Candidatus Kryptonia bacterium]|nr:glycosyltransferase [Candidatus Kryptonia bacterium]